MTVELNEQGEMMHRTEDNLDKIERNNKKSEYIVDGMGGIRGFFKNLFKKPPVE